MNRFFWPRIPLALMLMTAPLAASAAAIDGSSPLLCAAIETAQCEMDGDCVQGPPETINMPRFLRIDFENKLISGTEASGRSETTAIASLSRNNGTLILQGAENALGWTLVITEDSGEMSVAAARGRTAFMVFGACTPL